MTVLFLSIEFNYCCGISRSIFSLVKELRKRGHHIILGTPGGTMVNDYLEEGLEYFFLPVYPERKTVQDAWTCVRTIKNVIKKYNVDIVHSHHRLAEFLALTASILKKTPMVSTAHAIISGKKSLSFRSDKIIAVSDTVRKMLVYDFNVSNDVIHIIRNIPRTLRMPSVIEQNIFKRNNQISDDYFIVAGIGRLHQEKGFDIFLEALKKVKHLKNVRAILAGKGEEEIVLRNYSNKHGLNVIFAGETNDIELIYSIADVIVIPSRQESAGLVAIEAGFFHKPVIAANVGGLSETIADGLTGLLVAPESPKAIAGAIEILYHKRELSGQLGKQLFSYIKREYHVSSIVDQVESLYAQLISTNAISKNS